MTSLLVACSSPVPSSTSTPPPLAEELIFYDWEDDVPPSVLDAFAEEYGVKVTYVTYSSQEEALENLRAGEIYDVVVMDNRFIPDLKQEGLLARIDHSHVPNFRNISPNFRDLSYDPGNKYSIPFNWGTTGLVIRSDLVEESVSGWADLWDPRYAGKVGVWAQSSPRELIGLALQTLGYSINSEVPDELEAALKRLLELKRNALDLDARGAASSAEVLLSGEAVMAVGWAYDVVNAREENQAIQYVLPEEGTMLWGDNFVILTNSPRKYTAEVFLNFLLRPEIAAQIFDWNHFATPNEAAYSLIDPKLMNDPVIFPTNEDLKNSEIILPLSPEGEQLHARIWEQFVAAEP